MYFKEFLRSISVFIMFPQEHLLRFSVNKSDHQTNKKKLFATLEKLFFLMFASDESANPSSYRKALLLFALTILYHVVKHISTLKLYSGLSRVWDLEHIQPLPAYFRFFFENKGGG